MLAASRVIDRNPSAVPFLLLLAGVLLVWWASSGCTPKLCTDAPERQASHVRVWPQPPGLCLLPCSEIAPSPSPVTPAPAVVPNTGQVLRALPE